MFKFSKVWEFDSEDIKDVTHFTHRDEYEIKTYNGSTFFFNVARFKKFKQDFPEHCISIIQFDWDPQTHPERFI